MTRLPEVLLSEAAPGDRFWFWLTNRGPDRGPHLSLARQNEDPTAEAFASEVEQLTRRLGLVRSDHWGLVTVGTTGALCFQTEDVGNGLMTELQRLVRRYEQAVPSIGRLVGARHLRRSADVEPDDRMQTADHVWQRWVPNGRTVSGWTQLLAVASVLRRARAGDELMFWFVPRRVGESTLLLRNGSEREPFVADVKRIEGDVLDPYGVLGTIRVRNDGLELTIRADRRGLMPYLGDFVADNLGVCPELGRFMGATMVLVDEVGEAATSESIPNLQGNPPLIPADMAVQRHLQQSLNGVDEGAAYRFWFSARCANGAGALILSAADASDREHQQVVRQLIRGEPQSPAVVGQVKMSADGMRFRAKAPAPDFLSELAKFAVTHADAVPVIRALKNSRFRAMSASHEILDQQADDSLWSAL